MPRETTCNFWPKCIFGTEGDCDKTCTGYAPASTKPLSKQDLIKWLEDAVEEGYKHNTEGAKGEQMGYRHTLHIARRLRY